MKVALMANLLSGPNDIAVVEYLVGSVVGLLRPSTVHMSP